MVQVTQKGKNMLGRMSLMQKYTGCAREAVAFLEKEQLLDERLWKIFVEQYRAQLDGTNKGWRGEYWGKMMRGAVTVYQYSQNEALYQTLTDTVRDMMTVAEEDGRVSSFTRDTEFTAWDLWCRKYVMLGMEYYLEICKDEALKQEIITFLSRCADYIIVHIGSGEGQKEIVDATGSWLGLNSSSILEPMVRLYRLTGEERYFDFATYIVKTGGAKGVNIFELAYENKVYPYQYGVSKAYEMTSCFEGLLEYYEVTGVEKYKTAALNFGKAILDSDVTVIGTCGSTGELLDHSKVRQTAFCDDIMQETCVTVTWMKFCSRLLRLSGEAVFADCMEHSFYNAYLGSLNTEHKDCPYIIEKFVKKFGEEIKYTFLPFDSYSPLRPGKRGQKVGGSQSLSDHSYYGCCTCIGAAGVGVYLGHTLLLSDGGVTLNFFEQGKLEFSYNGVPCTIEIDTAYPANGLVKLTLKTSEPVEMKLRVRVPAWSENTVIAAPVSYEMANGYADFTGVWEGETAVEITFDMKLKETLPISWEEDVIYTDMRNLKPGFHHANATKVYHKPEDDDFISLSYGPLTLCADSRTGKDATTAFSFARDGEGKIVYTVEDTKEITAGVPCLLSLGFTDKDGNPFRLVDYASAGRDWDTVIAAWMPV